jgi:Skp family chaperone for outer membrane proteins
MIKKTLISILLITLAASATVYARTFKIASYNVENLFDMVNNRSEYDQYIPGEYGCNE